MKATFTTGNTYGTRSICDNDCIFDFKVIARTANTITIESNITGVKTCRINKKDSEFFGCEAIRPLGTYSMCPILKATEIM